MSQRNVLRPACWMLDDRQRGPRRDATAMEKRRASVGADRVDAAVGAGPSRGGAMLAG